MQLPPANEVAKGNAFAGVWRFVHGVGVSMSPVMTTGCPRRGVDILVGRGEYV